MENKLQAKQCQWCGSEFIPRTKIQKCCSRVCGNKLAYKNTNRKVATKRKAVRSGKVCKTCGTDFQAKRSDALFCSVKCNKRHYWKQKTASRSALSEMLCLHCSSAFLPRTRQQKHCSDACAKARSYQAKYELIKAHRLRARAKLPPRLCSECGTPFTVTHRDETRQKFCGKVCLARRHSGEVGARRAAIVLSSEADDIDWFTVAERYQWKCAGCHRDVKAGDRGKRRTTTPEIDHIMPISKGGTHTYDNIQLLCYSCNRSKAARVVSGVVSLFAHGDR